MYKSIDTNSSTDDLHFVLLAVAPLCVPGNPLWSRRLFGVLLSYCSTYTLVREEARTGYGNRSLWFRTRWILFGASDSVLDRPIRGVVDLASPRSIQSRHLVCASNSIRSLKFIRCHCE